MLKTVNPPCARRNFGVAMLCDKVMVVYGGINPNEKYLNDMYVINYG